MAGEALSKTASATSLTIAFHKKCDKEWRKLRDKLEAQFQEDIGRLYAKSLYWDLEVVVNCKTIRAHHSILQVRAPKFFSHLCAISEPSSPNSRYSSAALEKASVDYLESFIRNIYVKNSIEEEENSVLKYLDSVLLSSRKYDSGFGDIEKNDSILSPESDVYVTPKASPSEIIEQFGLIHKDNPPSHGNGDRLNHTTTFLPLDKTIKESDYYKAFKSPDFGSTEDSIFNSSLTAKSPISDREAQASYYSIVPLDDVCREERPRHLDLKGKGFAPAFINPAGEVLEKELAEQDELLKSFQSILSKEEGKTERSKFSAKRSIPVARGSPRLGIPVRDTSRSRDSGDRIPRPSREVTRRDVNRSLGARSKEVSVSRLPVRKQPKKVNIPATKNTSEKYLPGPSHVDLHLPITEQDSAISHNLNHKKEIKANVSLDLKPKNLKPELVSNHQDGTGSEMDGVIDYNEELGRQYPSKLSPCFCEAEEDEEEFLCSACSPCSPDMEGGVSSSQLDSGLDTGTSGSGGNPPPGGGITAGDPTPSDATSATTSSSWHCLHSVSSPLLPRDPSVPHLLSPSFVSMTTEGNGEPLGMLAGAECNSIAIGEDDTEAAVLSKLKSSSVSVSSGAVSDTDDVGMMEYDEADIRCDNLTSVKQAASNIDDMNRSKEPISFSESMTKSIEVYQTYDTLPQKGSEMVLPEQECLATKAEVLHTKLTNGIDNLCEDGATVTSWKLDHGQVDLSKNVCDSHTLKMNNNSSGMSQLDNLRSSELEENTSDATSNHNLLLNGGDVNKIEDVRLNNHIENGLTPPSCEEVIDIETTSGGDKGIINGETIETKSDDNQIHSDLSSFEIISTESSGENTMKTTQHFFIDAATLLDESEFVPSLETVQLETQKSPSKLSCNEASPTFVKEECAERHVLGNEPNSLMDAADESDDIEILAPPVEREEDEIANKETSPDDKKEHIGVIPTIESDIVEDVNTVKEILPDEQSVSAIEPKRHECHEEEHQSSRATSSNEEMPIEPFAKSSPTSNDGPSSRKMTIVETLEQEIVVSQICSKNVPEQKQPSTISPGSGEINRVSEDEQHANKIVNETASKKSEHPQLVNFQEVSTEVCTTVQFTTLSPTEDVNRSANFGTLTRNGKVKENLAVIDSYVPKVLNNFASQNISSLEKGVVDGDNELGNTAVPSEATETAPERSEQEILEKETKVSKRMSEAVPARVGELVRGDTFELQPGEERVTWFRQEHERRQGSMLFQGLQRGSSSDSINKGDNHNSHKGSVATDKASSHASQPGQYCAASVPHTQSLPPMLSTGMSLVEPPTPPNTLHRVKNHNQQTTAPFTTAAVDSIHKMFGEPHRIQGEIESISPIQRFTQRFRPSKEEDIQSPDSLNNDGPMESFCHDSVLINRIPAVGAPANDTGEEEEEVGPIVEKQTDEYLEKERRDDDDDHRPVVSGALTDADVVINQSHTDSLKRQKRTESTPIVSGGASAADFAQISPPRPTDSPLVRRRTEATPILSGGGPPMEEPKKETHTNGSPRCPRRWDGTPPPLSAWVVDMSDCCKGDSSSTGPSSLNSSWSPSTPEARKRHRRRRSEGMPFAVGNRGLRAVEFSEQPADEATPNSSFDSSDSRAIPKDHTEEMASSSTEEVNTEKKKPLFSMFIDIGDSCKGGSKGKDVKRPRELSSGMSVSWQGSSSHSKIMTESVENVIKSTNVKPSEAEAPKSSDSSKPNSVFMYIDASQPPKTKPDSEKEAKANEAPKEENPQTHRERQGFFMFIEAEPTPPVMRRPFHLKDGHLTSTPPSKRHSWNQEAPNVLEGIVGQGTSIRRHKRTQSLSVVGRSSSGSNVPHLLESASGEDSDIASQSASISSVSAGPASVSVADSSLSLVEGLDSGSSTGEFKIRGPIAKPKPMIGSSPENMGSSFEGSSKFQIPEEECEERSEEKVQPKVEEKKDISASVDVEEDAHQKPTGERKLGGTETLSSPRPEPQKKSAPVTEAEASISAKKSARPLSDSHVSDIKEGTDDDTKKQFVKLSDLDKSTTSVDDEAAMIESCDSFGNEDMLGSGSSSRRVRPVEEISWIESKSKQSVGSSGSRGRLLYPMGLGKGTTRSRRGRSESPGKSGSNSGASPAPAHRGEVGEEQPLSETASALSSMQSSVDRSALEGSTEETDMSSSLGGSRSAPCSRLGQDLLRMFLDEVNTDVTVEVEGRSVRAHKCILSSRCQYFAAMLSGGWVESAGNVISLQGFSYSAVHFALCHIYSGTSNIPETISIVELATLADMLGLEGLKEVIMYTLKVKYCHFFHKPCAVCAVGVLECLPLAAAYGLDEIYRKSLKWITKYFIRIWPSKAFAALPRELIDKCYHQHVVHMSVENILDTVMCCDKLLATLPNVRWAEPVFGITSQLLEAAVKFIADNFSGVVLSDKFQSLGKELSWNISRLEESITGAADMLSLEQACLSHINISHLLAAAASPDQETHETQWSTSFIDFLKRLEGRVEGRLVRGAGRVARCRSWMQLDAQVRRRIQEKACLAGLDQSSSSGSGRRRRIGGEEEDGGSSSGCGGSDDTHGSIGRRGRSRHSSLLRTSEQRPASARGSASSSIYCTIPRSASGRAKGKEGGANADARSKAGNGAVSGSSVPSQSQAVAAATALLDSKNKPARKERSGASVGTLANRSKSSSSRLHQKATEEVKPAPKKETPAPTVVTRPRKKISQLDKEKSASTVVGKSGGKPAEATENGVSRPKTWPMRIIEQSKSSRSSPQLPTASTGGVSSNTGTPEKASSVSSRVRISSSDSSRNSSPALRPKGVLRGAKTSRTFAPTRITKKPDGLQQQTSSPGSASQTQLAKDGTSSPRRVVGAKSVSSRPTPDSASSRASNSPVANLRRTSTAAGRAAQQAASVTPTPKRAAWSRTKASGPALVKQNSAGAAPSPPRTSTVRGGNEVASRKVAPGSKPRTPLVERSTRPYSPKATNGGSAPSSTGVKKKPGPVQGALIHSRDGSNVSLDKGKEETVAPSGVGERSGTFLKDEPTVLKRPENVE